MALPAFSTSCNVLPSSKRCKHLLSPRASAAAEWDAGYAHLLSTTKRSSVSKARHSGAYFIRRDRSPQEPFFEGWYLRAVLPKTSESFAFMFAVEANASGARGTVQVAGPDDKNRVHELADGLSGFSASPNSLKMCHWGSASAAAESPRFLSPQAFKRHVTTGYQLAERECAGRIPAGSSGVVEWGFRFLPVLSWGERGRKSRFTASWLSRFPIFDTGYQILMAHGVATGGRICYCDKTYEMEGARVYAEKNWGSTFPKKWWWVQANAFPENQDLSVTAVGAKRMVLGLEETVGIIAIHLNGLLYEFGNWNSTIKWNVIWGHWEARAVSRTGHEATLSATTGEKGIIVLGPTVVGMKPNVRDAMHGTISVTLRAPNGNLLLNRETCCTAQVETGGSPWAQHTPWIAEVRALPQPLRGTVNLFNGTKVQTCK